MLPFRLVLKETAGRKTRAKEVKYRDAGRRLPCCALAAATSFSLSLLLSLFLSSLSSLLYSPLLVSLWFCLPYPFPPPSTLPYLLSFLFSHLFLLLLLPLFLLSFVFLSLSAAAHSLPLILYSSCSLLFVCSYLPSCLPPSLPSSASLTTEIRLKR